MCLSHSYKSASRTPDRSEHLSGSVVNENGTTLSSPFCSCILLKNQSYVLSIRAGVPVLKRIHLNSDCLSGNLSDRLAALQPVRARIVYSLRRKDSVPSNMYPYTVQLPYSGKSAPEYVCHSCDHSHPLPSDLCHFRLTDGPDAPWF